MTNDNLNWIKCQGDVWCSLNSMNLAHQHFDNLEGVYIIWHGGIQPKVVYVGMGNIRERLRHHRNDPSIQRYSYNGLFVTWASVEKSKQPGIEAHLISKWKPLANVQKPNKMPIVVNSPF